jgi:hypothetical protein
MNNPELVAKYNSLLVERMRLDKFFSLFLDKFEGKMDHTNTNTPVWKLYKLKLKEYDTLQRDIKSTEYWMKKEYHV